MKLPRCGMAAWMAMLCSSGACAADLRSEIIDFNIPERPLDEALDLFRSQSGLKLVIPGEVPRRLPAPAVTGRLTPEAALEQLLAPFDITSTFAPPATFALQVLTLPAPLRPTLEYGSSAAIPEAVIRGSLTLNTDQVRSVNDAFSYIVFDADAMSISGAMDARTFFATELPSYSPRGVALGAAAIMGAGGQITVRGLPSSETIILFDGHRRAGSYSGGDMQQPDLSVTPLFLLSRIEVRTASASALFGSHAAVGSLNLIRDRKSPRTRFFLRSEELTGISSGAQQFVVEHVMELGNGSGWLAMDGAVLRQDPVTLGERNFVTRGREQTARNNPDAFAKSMTPVLGRLRNVHAVGPFPFAIGEGAWFLHLPQNFKRGDDPSVLVANANEYDLSLAASAQSMGERSSLRPERRIYSFSTAAGWQVTDAISIDVDSGFSDSLREGFVSALDTAVGQLLFVPSWHEANPIGEDLLAVIATDMADSKLSRRDRSTHVTVGSDWRFSKETVMRLDHAWSSARATIRHSALGGDLSQLTTLLMSEPVGRESLTQAGLWLAEIAGPEFRNTLEETTLRLSSSKVEFPKGFGSLTVAAQRLYEKIAVGSGGEVPALGAMSATPEARVAAQRAQRTLSLLGSAKVPVGDVRDDSYGARLTAELSLRRDSVMIEAAPDAIEQRTFRFHAFSAGVGLHWQALDRWALRVQCSTGFLPPPLSSLGDKSSMLTGNLQLVDPARGDEPLNEALVISGGDYDLRPIESHSCGGGFVWEGPEKRWRLSVDYNRLVKDDVVLNPSDLFFKDPQKYLTEFASRVKRAEPAPGDPWEVGQVESIETWSINIARQQIETVDIQLASKSDLFNGDLVFSLLASAQPVSTHRAASSSERENDAGVSNLASPVWRGVASLAWTRANLTIGLSSRYTSSYDVSRVEAIRTSQGDGGQVASQNYVDVFAAYDLSTRWLAGTKAQLRLDAGNVLGREPPADLGEWGYASRIGLEEFRSISLSLRLWH